MCLLLTKIIIASPKAEHTKRRLTAQVLTPAGHLMFSSPAVILHMDTYQWICKLGMDIVTDFHN